MASLTERCSAIWNSLRQSQSDIPTGVMIPADHVEGQQAAPSFKPGEHYFQVRVNEMYLAFSRQWFAGFEPMVFVVSEFVYDKQREAIPFVVGPQMMEKYGQKLPAGMIFSDTRVAGLHPYRGGRLTLSVVLYKVQSGNMARSMLRMIENAANVLDFSTALASYVKVADVVLDGVEALLDLGNSVPLIGLRKEFDPYNEELKPSYFALINRQDNHLDTSKLWVKDRKLCYGDSLQGAEPFRQADFVLYSITQTSSRSDLTTLPFYPQWERAQREALDPKEDSWLSAKANMATLAQSMLLSPDLTDMQAELLLTEWTKKLQRFHKMAVGDAKRSTKPSLAASPAMDKVRGRSLAILKS